MSYHFANQMTMDFVEPRQTHHPVRSIGNKQNAKILAYLNEGKSLTALDALQMFGCFRLASRIHDLRKAGVDVKVAEHTTAEGKKVARYYL